MTTTEQCIAIAEACGIRPEMDLGNIPRYTSSLDAMHQAEKCLNALQRGLYRDELVDTAGDSYACFATAEQRAKAFLRVIGKWQP